MRALEQQLMWHEHQMGEHKTTQKLLKELVGKKQTGEAHKAAEAAEATGQQRQEERQRQEKEKEEKGERPKREGER